MTNGELTGYHDWLVRLKAKIRSAQIRAVTAVNSELTILYWQIGRDIIERQERQGWGTNVVGQLAADLLREFPDMKGWSRSNLMAMRAFVEAWPDEEIVQQLVGQFPWGHNLKLLSGLKTPFEREWYARRPSARMESQCVGSPNGNIASPAPRRCNDQFQKDASRPAV